ncbi:hypothetical protein PMAYCL1PPCAC_01336, partial [Pristionchus mayeri]
DEAVREVEYNVNYDPKAKEQRSKGDYSSYYEVRLRVFCDEQMISIDDEVDGEDGKRKHYALFRGKMALAVCRLSIESPYIKLERVACLREERGRGFARRLILEVLRIVDEQYPKEVVVAHSQTTVLKFYERLGFVAVSCEFLDEVNILHRSIAFPPRRERVRTLSLLSSAPSKHSEFVGDLYDEEVVRTIRRMVEDIESLSFLPLPSLVSTHVSSVFVTSSLHELLCNFALRTQRVNGYAENYIPFSPPPATIDVQSSTKSDVQFLKAVAFKMLNTGHYSEVDENWRHFYALLYLTMAVEKRTDDTKKSLRLLDKGLLMGRDLGRTLADLAESLSREMSSKGMDFTRMPLSSMDRTHLTPSLPVKVVDHPADNAMFLADHLLVSRPLLVRGCVREWAACSKWSLPWFLQHHGQRTAPVEIGSKYTDDNWSQQLMTIEKFCEEALKAEPGRPLYLAQHRLLEQIPSLKEDIKVPWLCLAGTSAPDDVDMNFWMGLADTVSPLHTDPRENLFCQVLGSKFVRLISPQYSDAVGAFEEGILTNTSQLDAETLEGVECFDVEVHAGDALFIPSGWWHYVRALSPSISVSCWFDR